MRLATVRQVDSAECCHDISVAVAHVRWKWRFTPSDIVEETTLHEIGTIGNHDVESVSELWPWLLPRSWHSNASYYHEGIDQIFDDLLPVRVDVQANLDEGAVWLSEEFRIPVSDSWEDADKK